MPFYSELWYHEVLLLGALTLSALLAYFITLRLQYYIYNPILHLATIARQVTKEENWSIRATKTGEDELGQAVDAFNSMLVQNWEKDKDDLEEIGLL